MGKKEKRLAMASAIQNSSDNIVVVDDFASLTIARTKLLLDMIQKYDIDPMKQKVLLISKASNHKLLQAGRNAKMVTVSNLSSLNIFDILNAEKIVMEKDALMSINS